MFFRYYIVLFRLALLLLLSVVEASAQKAPSAKPFERFDGCVLAPDEWTDGDSFRVRLPDGRLETFRLYFVDTTESRSRGKRSDEQAAYFGLTRAEAIKLGQEAKAFTAAALQKPFTIQTRWRPVYGSPRYYAFALPKSRLIGHNFSMNPPLLESSPANGRIRRNNSVKYYGKIPSISR
jgi:hypothetical protein